MIKHLYVTGDTHGSVMPRLSHINSPPEETAVIVLGDVGFNFWLNKTDKHLKQAVQDSGFTVYCVRGNHEERPENIEGMIKFANEEIYGPVYLQPQYPNIKYLIDGQVYNFNGNRTLVIGGAYSVDKWYRLSRKRSNGWSGWFKDEQLTEEEMQNISDFCKGQSFDLVLSHTCPYSWMPTDLFLNGIDQNSVDNSMERWLDELKEEINYNIWLFGHYHDDRLVRHRVEMYFNDIEELNDIINRWQEGHELEWYLKKDPNYDCKR